MIIPGLTLLQTYFVVGFVLGAVTVLLVVALIALARSR